MAVLARNIWGHSPMASAVARTYNGGLGAEPTAGSRGRASGQGSKGRSPSEAEALLVFGLSMEAANRPLFYNLETQKIRFFCVIFAKNHEWPRNSGDLEQNWGLVPPRA